MPNAPPSERPVLQVAAFLTLTCGAVFLGWIGRSTAVGQGPFGLELLVAILVIAGFLAVAVARRTILPQLEDARAQALCAGEQRRAEAVERGRAEQRLQAQAARLRMLCDIISKPDAAFTDQVRELLVMSRRELGLENGMLARVEGNRLEITHAASESNPGLEGFVCDLQDTLGHEVLLRDEPLAFEHGGASEWRHHLSRLKFKAEAYIGVPVSTAGRVYGVLCFTSSQPRAQKFTSADKEFLRLLGQWVGSEVERRQTHESLRESERKLITAQDLAHLGSWEWEIAANKITWSDELYRIFGLTPGAFDATFEAYLSAVHPADRERVNEDVVRTLHDGTPFSYDCRILRSDGDVRFVHAWGERLLDEAGRPWSMAGSFQDLTELKQAEQALLESEQRTRLIVDTALDAVITMDEAGRITQWNRQAESVFGWPAHHVVGHRLSGIIIPPNQRDAHERGLRRFLASGEGPILDRRIEVTALHCAGHEFPMELAITAHRVGDVCSFSAFCRDISERQRIEEDLRGAKEAAEAASRTKSQFLANMSHELRTPLNAILGYSEMLREDAEETGDSEALADLNKIHSAGRHLLGLISDILDVSQIEAGKMNLHLETFSVPELVNDLVSMVLPLVEQNGNTLTVHCPEETGLLHADMTKVRQVLFNLLSNAAKFTREGAIQVEVARRQAPDGEWLTFAVSDFGIGISPEQLPRLFQDFVQADGSSTREYGGTGLGLAISRRLCELMGGEITVISEVGEGSTFTLHLPTVAAPASVDPGQAAAGVA